MSLPLIGLIAGAAGTVALNVSTYLDMLVRGRPPSEVPARVAGRAADAAGIEPLTDAAGEEAKNRRSGAGALLGYATGLGLGVAYALWRRDRRDVPVPLAGAALGLAAMASSDVPAVTAGATDPREWGPSAWLADIVPHLAYGLVTVAAFELLATRRRP